MLQKSLRSRKNFAVKIEFFLVDKWWKGGRCLRSSRSSEFWTWTFVVWASYTSNKQYTTEVRWDLDKLKREVTWLRKEAQNWQMRWEKNEKNEQYVLSWCCQLHSTIPEEHSDQVFDSFVAQSQNWQINGEKSLHNDMISFRNVLWRKVIIQRN